MKKEKLTNPVQRVVPAAACANGSGGQGHERAVAAATPPARIEEIIARRISEARRDFRCASALHADLQADFASERTRELESLLSEVRRTTAAGGGGSNEALSGSEGRSDAPQARKI